MPMQVLHVAETLSPDAGSVGIFLRGLFDVLRAQDIESEVHEASGADRRPSDPSALGKLVTANDVVHIHGWGRRAGRLAAKLAGAHRKPYVISPYGLLCEGPYRRRSWREKLHGLLGENRLIRRAAAVTAINEQEEHELRRQRVHDNIRHLPCGLVFSDYEDRGDESAALPEPLEGRCILLLGPIHPVEGFIPVLRAFAELGRVTEGWHVVLAGRETGDWRKMLEAAVRRKGAADQVRFSPAPDEATQRAWLARAAVLVAPSLHVRCPVSIMQALAAGVPVVATKPVAPAALTGAIKICETGRSAIKEALRSVLGLSDEERTAMAREARDAGRGLFDLSALADRYARLYRELV
jgi:poly(glycerol-phosphate) alpha-glucosyltransferase